MTKKNFKCESMTIESFFYDYAMISAVFSLAAKEYFHCQNIFLHLKQESFLCAALVPHAKLNNTSFSS